jgi:hypothetical protein
MKHKIQLVLTRKPSVHIISTFFPRARLIKIVSILFIICILSVGIEPFIQPTHASGSFTASNVTFDPTTGRLQFDYTGGLTSGVGQIVDTSNHSKGYWTVSFQNCNGTTCYAAMAPDYYSDNGVTSVQIRDGATDYSQALNYPLPQSTANSPQYPSAGGWTNVGETWTYASADSPTYSATLSGDFTNIYSPGMRIKLTQSSTTKYFLITGVSYSSPNTTITLYGGTDYTLANSTISSVYFSSQKAPLGFPQDPTKWTVTSTYSSNGNQGSPTANTWYNIGSASITVPVGAWKLSYSTNYGYDSPSAGAYKAYTTLSTSNSSASDSSMSTTFVMYNSAIGIAQAYDAKIVNLSSKTTYYLNVMSPDSGLNDLYMGDSSAPSVMLAVSSYL